MPKDCFECPLYNLDHICVILKRQNLAFDKPIDCPLVEVVRCKDCKKRNTRTCMMNNNVGMNKDLFDDDYCSYGERREQKHE